MARNQSASRRTRRIVDCERIREMRLDRELTLAAAAALIGCHRTHLASIESGTWGASEIMLRKIARAYGTTLDEISSRSAA